MCGDVGLYLGLCGGGIVSEKGDGFGFYFNNKFDICICEGFYYGFVGVVNFDILKGSGEE